MTAAAGVLLASTPRQRVTLSPRPIGEGGQAAVFGVTADPGMVVKLYHRPSAEIERRLESMLLLARPDEFRSDSTAHPALTWPSAMVEDVDTGAVLGYAMQRVGAPEFLPLGTLFNPMQRRQHFPDISWRFLVGLARNLAGLIAVLHDRDLVLGDISHANLVVSQRGYLTFLDCDSMQFTDPRSGEHFPCLFLTAEYASPELQRDEGMERSPATDDFSLAILVCRLLLVGDHPFMGIRVGGHDDDADASRNIVDGYSYLVRPEEMGLPPGTLDPGLLPPPVLALGRRAFGPGHADPSARPTAEEWLEALDSAMQTTASCGLQRHHAYSDHLPGCPWCARTQAGGPDVFRSPQAPPRLQVSPANASAVHGLPGWLVPAAVIAVVVLILLALALVL
jgi:DNA-binding helix-hairpin-helix protein with protein kinase domain